MLWQAFNRFDKNGKGKFGKPEISVVFREVEHLAKSSEVSQEIEEISRDVELPMDFDAFVFFMYTPAGQTVAQHRRAFSRLCWERFKIDLHIKPQVHKAHAILSSPLLKSPYRRGSVIRRWRWLATVNTSMLPTLDADAEDNCVICWSLPPDPAHMLPCGHCRLCAECTAALLLCRQERSNCCPLCRAWFRESAGCASGSSDETPKYESCEAPVQESGNNDDLRLFVDAAYAELRDIFGERNQDLPDSSLVCVCGTLLDRIEAEDAYDGACECDLCGETIHHTETILHCPRGCIDEHPHAWDVCMCCARRPPPPRVWYLPWPWSLEWWCQ